MYWFCFILDLIPSLVFFTRIKEIETIEESMLKDGRIPYEEDNEDGVDINEDSNMEEVDIIRE